jgi:predicted 3-demethylubiquinone-9 3-methyltransferase (glyoxalase superfamily)
MTTVTPFLMFEGNAEAAMNRYVDVLPDRQPLRFFDSFVHHDFSFTPALSLFVTADSVADLDRIVDALALGGSFLMPPDDYGFSRRFAWFNDEFGGSWQINVE